MKKPRTTHLYHQRLARSGNYQRNFEPWVKLEIITPIDYLGAISDLVKEFRAIYLDTNYVGNEKLLLSYEIPLRKSSAAFTTLSKELVKVTLQ